MAEQYQCPYFFTPFQPDSDRPLFVFLPGMDETGKVLMTLQTAGLETAFDVRCFVIPAAILNGWESMAQKLLALIQAELKHASRPIYLCGESFGTCVALTAMAKAPDLFDRIILINSASSFHRVPLLTFGSFLLPWTPQCLYNVSSILAVPLLAQVTRLSSSACEALVKAAQAAPKRTAEQRLELLRNFSIDEARLQKIAQPVLLIGSQNDRLLPSVAEAHRLAKVLPNAQIMILPGSGHACLVEAEVDLIALLQGANFLPA